MFVQEIEIAAGIIANEQSFSGRAFHVFVDENGSSGRLQGLVIIFGMVHKNNVSRFHHVDLVDARYLVQGVPDELTMNNGGNFFDADGLA
jgi:predicted cupin superfamily sugar epimerase